MNELSKCCNATSSYLSDELCAECLEHTTFDEVEQDESEEMTDYDLQVAMWTFYRL